MISFSIKWGLITLIVLAALMALVAYQLSNQKLSLSEFFDQPAESVKPKTGDSEVDTADWNTYTSSEFGFRLRYPSDWAVHAYTDPEPGRFIVPAVNVYSPADVGKVYPPFDHFAPVTAVSVNPEGVPTEGVFGRRVPAELKLQVGLKEAWNYLLENDQDWASYIKPSSPPEPWKPHGFLWARNQVQDLEVSCYRGEAELPMDECDPMTGDTLRRTGQVDPGKRATVEAILQSFQFTDR